MLKKQNSLNININTCKSQGIILNTLYNAYKKDKSREVDLGVTFGPMILCGENGTISSLQE